MSAFGSFFGSLAPLLFLPRSTPAITTFLAAGMLKVIPLLPHSTAEITTFLPATMPKAIPLLPLPPSFREKACKDDYDKLYLDETNERRKADETYAYKLHTPNPVVEKFTLHINKAVGTFRVAPIFNRTLSMGDAILFTKHGLAFHGQAFATKDPKETEAPLQRYIEKFQVSPKIASLLSQEIVEKTQRKTTTEISEQSSSPS